MAVTEMKKISVAAFLFIKGIYAQKNNILSLVNKNTFCEICEKKMQSEVIKLKTGGDKKNSETS